jgi:hypothetical protein
MTGEVTIKIFDEEVTAKVDFTVLKRIEERVNVVEYISQMRMGEPFYSHTAWIIYCTVGQKLRKSELDVGNWCIDNLGDASSYATEIVLQIVKPSPEVKKKDNESGKRKPKG